MFAARQNQGSRERRMLYVTHIYQSAHGIDGCGNQGGTADIDFVPYQGWSFFVLWKVFGISIKEQGIPGRTGFFAAWQHSGQKS